MDVELPDRLQAVPEIAFATVTFLHRCDRQDSRNVRTSGQNALAAAPDDDPDFGLGILALDRPDRRREDERIADLLRFDQEDAHLPRYFLRSDGRMSKTLICRSAPSIQYFKAYFAETLI